MIRATGGDNAGHTILNPFGEFKMHLIPAGIFHADTLAIIGNGVVLNPQGLLNEMAILTKAGVDISGLRISDRAHLVMPWHPLQDKLEEQQRGGSAIGTTGRGIGPAYTDRASRIGVRVADLRDEGFLTEKVMELVERKNQLFSLYGAPPLDAKQILEGCFAFAEQIEPYIVATEILVQDALDAGQEVLVEGAQAALLDLDFGTYPYVTSSFPTAAGSCAGAGIAPTQVRETLGVFKAYCTRVGGGPFPTELDRCDRRPHPRAWPGVRHHHRASAPLRLVRCGRGALRRPSQRYRAVRADPLRYPRYDGGVEDLRRLRV